MTTRRIPWLCLNVLTLVLLGGAVASGAESAVPNAGVPSGGGLTELLKLVGSPTFPSLAGLIQPERMGLLTDNKCHAHDNRAELKLLSDNKTQVLSGNRILSGITIHVHVHMDQGGDQADDPKAEKYGRKSKADKSRKRKSAGKSKED